MRVRNEPISVRVSPDCAPTQFIWRARLWRVLAVQRRWVEAGAWWDDPRVRRARGQDAATRWSNELGEPGPPREPELPDGDLLGDRTVWRVEAAAGAGADVGIYELACRGSDWRLRTVID
ncbi:MAG: DUF6504 family protein [Brooklawnia sp.]|uniref:DUF6504 family protein n=1 Tax=Brooklawnia sp. TaxID=2699740 RepID=UPI003C757FAC